MAPNAERVPNVVITLPNPKGTCRVVIGPIFEAALIQRRLGASAKVVTAALPATDPNGRPWADDMKFTTFLGGISAAENRMRAKYDKPNDSVFDAVYGFGQFETAYARAISGEWKANKPFEYGIAVEPEPEERRMHPATKIANDLADAMAGVAKPTLEAMNAAAVAAEVAVHDIPELREAGVSKALRTALVAAGITSVSAVMGMSTEALVALPGIGPKSALVVKDAASRVVAAEAADDVDDELANLTE
jgi:hypothetical protein